MKNKKKEITIEKVKIVGGDFFEDLVKDYAKHPKKLKKYIESVNQVYRETGDTEVLTTALKIVAITKKNIKQQAKKAKIQRSTIYNLFKKGSNPTFKTVANYTNSLGIHLQLSL